MKLAGEEMGLKVCLAIRNCALIRSQVLRVLILGLKRKKTLSAF